LNGYLLLKKHLTEEAALNQALTTNRLKKTG
jgi:hypothetical protein